MAVPKVQKQNSIMQLERVNERINVNVTLHKKNTMS